MMTLDTNYIEIKNNNKENPKTAIIQVGKKVCDDTFGDVFLYDENITEIDLYKHLIIDRDFYDRILVQLPLPQHIRKNFMEVAYE